MTHNGSFVLPLLRMYLAIIALLLLTWKGNAQSMVSNWILQSDHTFEDYTYSIAADTLGDFIYIGGSIEQITDATAADFGNTTGSSIIYTSGEGDREAFICKMDMTGNILWFLTMGGNQNDAILDICVGADGNIYFAGYYDGNFQATNIDGSNLTSLSELGGGGESNCFIGSYSPSGTLRWLKNEGGTQNDKYFSISTTSDGIVALGTFFENNNETLLGQNISSSNNDEDVFIAKYGFDGSDGWLIAGGSEEPDYDHGLDAADLHYSLTSYRDTLYFMTSFMGTSYNFDYATNYSSINTAFNITSSQPLANYAIGSITNDGKIIWLRRQLQDDSNPRGMAIGADCNGVFAAGVVGDNLNWEGPGPGLKPTTGNGDAFVIRYNHITGAPEWYRFMSNSTGESDVPSDIITDIKGNIYICGINYSNATIGGGTLPGESNGAGYVLSLNKDGLYRSRILFNSIGTQERVSCIALTKNLEIVAAGWGIGNIASGQNVLNTSNDSFWSYINNTPVVSATCCSGVSFTCLPNQTIPLTTGCTAALPNYLTAYAGATCPAYTFTQNPLAGTALNQGTHTVTISNTLNQVICTFDVTVTDPPPTVLCPTIQTLSLGTNCSVGLPDYSFLFSGVTDNCTTGGNFTFIQTPPAGTNFSGQQSVAVAMTISDQQGNSSSCSFLVNIVDNTGPSMICPADTTIILTAGCSTVFNYPMPVITDNCISCAATAIPGFTYLNTLNGNHYYLSTSAANWATANTTCIANGGHLMTITSAAENALANALLSQYWIGLSDAVTEGTFQWVTGESLSYTNWVLLQPDNLFNQDYVVTNSVLPGLWSDESGSGSYPYLLEIECPFDISTVQLESGIPSGGTFTTGTHNITFKATDSLGNSNYCDFQVTVVDGSAPTINCPIIPPVMLNGNCNYTLPDYRPLAGVSDNCTSTANLIVSQYPLPGTILGGPGSYTIFMRAEDLSGNFEVCSFILEIEDNTPPSILCPANITVNATDCNAVVNFASPTATNTCNACAPLALTGYTLIGDHNGHRYFRSEASVSWPDAYGQAVLTGGHLAEITSDEEVAFLESAGIAWIGLTDIDEEMNFQWISGEPFIYSNWALNDPNDFGGEDFVLINWLPGGKWIDGGNTTNWPFILEFDCTDNTPVITQINGLPSGSAFSIGNHPITFVAADQSGNSASCTFSITVNDIAPTITCPGNQILPSGTNCQASLPSYRHLALVSDNCSPVNITDVVQSPAPGTIVSGTTTVTLTVTDDSGLFSQCTFSVSLADTIAPVIVQPANLFPNVSGSCAFVLPDYTTGAITDNCTPANAIIKTQFPAPGVTIKWPTQVYITATDVSGNYTVISFIITPTDAVPPSIGCNPDIILTNEAGVCESSVAFNISFTENCGCNAPASIPGFALIGSYNGHTYFRSTGATTWQNAYNNAITLGAHLVTISSEEENEFLPNSTTNYWIGLTDKYSEGTFQWVTGEPLVYQNWEAGEPNNTSDEDYVHTNHLNPFEWNDENATASRRYIIEFDCAASDLEPRGIVHFDSGDLDVEYNETVVFPVDTTAVEFIITDYSGLADTCYFNVIIHDETLPTITCENSEFNTEDGLSKVRVPNQTKAEELGYVIDPNDIYAMENFDLTGIDDVDLDCYYYLDIHYPPVDDNCGVGSVWNSYSGSDEIHAYFPCGTTEVMWYVRDIYNNVDSCLSYVIINDNTAPVIDCEDLVQVNNLTDDCDGYASVPSPTVYDECGSVTIWNNYNGSPDASDVYPHWLTDVEFAVSDESGNTAYCTTVVDVLDVQAPTINAPATDTLLMNEFCQGIVPDYELEFPVFENCYEVYWFAQSPGAGNVVNDGDIVNITVMDPHGQFSEYTIQVVLQDTIAPDILCPGDIVVSVAAGFTDVYVTVPPATFNDNCGTLAIQTMVDGNPVFSPSGTFDIGVHTVEWTAVDGYGNASTCSTTITVNTNDFPTISCPADIEISNDTDQCGAYVVVPMPTYSDDGVTSVPEHNSPYSDSGINNASGFYPIGSHVITWVTTDDTGNTSSCTMEITVNDVQFPELICSGNLSVALPAGQCALPSTSLSLGSPVTNDNCGINVLSNNLPAMLPVGTTIVTWTVSDIHGNTATCTQQIEVLDNEFPVISCPPAMSFNLPNGQCHIPSTSVNIGNATATDNCGNPIITRIMPANFVVGANSVVWTATDVNGNASTCTQIVTIIDNQPPQISCPPDITVANESGTCAVSSASVFIGAATATDNCGVAGITNTIPGYFNIGNNYVTWTATDVNGNPSSCTQIVFVQDTEPPVIICPDTLFTQTDPGSCSVLTSSLDFSNVTASDNCTNLTITNNAPLTLDPGVHDVTHKAVDNFGNSATCIQVVVVQDNDNPTIICPADLQVANDPGLCGADTTSFALGYPFINDNCGIAYVENNAPAFFPIGTTSVLWQIHDVNGNTTSCIQQITVQDEEPPVISGLSDININTETGQCSISAASINLGIPVVSDNCVLLPVVNDAPSLFDVGATIVTWVATDIYGNSGSITQVITVIDNQPPLILCPDTVFAFTEPGACFALMSSLNTGSPLVSENCSAYSISNNAPVSFSPGQHEIIWTATDANSNSSSCAQIIVIQDLESPTITCPADIIGTAGPGLCGADLSSIALGSPSVSDNCGIAYFEHDAPSFFPIGNTIVNWTSTDIHGNSSSCQQTVTIIDNDFPYIACPNDISVFAASGQCGLPASSVNLGNPVATDNCSSLTPTNDAPLFFNIGSTVVTWTVTDDEGQTSTCEQTVTVVDSELPEIDCPDDISSTSESAGCGIALASLNLGTPVVTDNCSIVSFSNDAPLYFPVGTTTITWIAEDGIGQVSSCQQFVEIEDVTPPAIDCPADLAVTTTPGSCFAESISLGLPDVSDNCGVAGFTNDAPLVFPVGTTTITWTLTDIYNNQSSCQQLVEVEDVEAPLVLCPGDVTVYAAPGQCSVPEAFVNLGTPNIAENCTLAGILNNAPASFNPGTTEVIWTITDVNGLSSTCSQYVHVLDTIPPQIACPADLTLNAENGLCGLPASSVNHGTPVVSDNCSVDLVSKNSPVIYPIGTTDVEWTVTDNSGLTATCIQHITIIDNQSPVIDCPDDINVVIPEGSPNITLTIPSPTYSDNCSVNEVTWELSGATTASSVSTGINILNSFTFEIGVTTIVYTATDIHGLTSNCDFTITVVDSNAPEIVCANDTTVYVLSGCSVLANLPAPVATDQDGIFSVINNYNNSSDASGVYATGNYEFTWTATDMTGNINSCTTELHVVDTIAPELNCSGDVQLFTTPGICSKSFELPIPGATDNCSIESLTWTIIGATVYSSPNTGINSSDIVDLGFGLHLVTYILTDTSGNASTCQYEIFVTDIEPPVITCQDTIFVNTLPGLCSIPSGLVNIQLPTATDNCAIPDITGTIPASFSPGINSILWTATDDSGHQSSCEQIVVVIDIEQPSINCGDTIFVNLPTGSCSIEFDDISLSSITASDNCGIDTLMHNAPSSLNPGTHSITWTAYDLHGNTQSCEQIVVVEDDEAPSITCNPDITVAASPGICEISAGTLNLLPPVATDNCTIPVITHNAPGTFPVGTTTVEWTATDNFGNSSYCLQNIFVTDNEDPTITCPPNMVVATDPGSCGTLASNVNEGTAVATDNCNLVWVTNDAPVFYPVGNTTILWTATDAANNAATCPQVISVVDNEYPVIQCPDTVFVNALASTCGIPENMVNVGNAFATDNCPGVAISSQGPSYFSVGPNTIQWKAIDAHGQISYCNQIIMVMDNQNPVMECPGNITVSSSPGICGISLNDLNLINPSATDNCGIPFVSHNAPAFFNIGVTSILWTATDASGNTTTCTQFVEVTDSEDPILICPDEIHAEITDATTSMEILVPEPTYTDNCGILSLTWMLSGATTGASPGTGIHTPGILTFNSGVTIVTFTATDINNNSVECSFSVTVTDANSPQIICPDDVTVYLTDSCDVFVNIAQPVASDNEGIDWTTNNITNTDNASAEYIAGEYDILWITSDISGNQNSCTQHVSVLDTIAPTLLCAQDITVYAQANQCGINLEIPIPSYTDNCNVTQQNWSASGATTAQDNSSGFNIPGTIFLNTGSTHFEFTALDESGNSATCGFNIVVTDSIPPVITCPGDLTESVDTGTCSKLLTITTPVCVDNCGSFVISNNINGTDQLTHTFPAGVTLITWTAIDQFGNSNTCVQVVTITGADPIIISCPNDTIIPNDPGECFGTLDISGQLAFNGGCESYTISNDHPGDTFNAGMNQVIWTIAGDEGYSSTCIQHITVEDIELPIITSCPSDQTAYLAEDCNFIIPDFTTALVVQDNCTGIYTINQNPAAGTLVSGHNTTIDVQLNVSDSNGLTASCAFQLLLLDTISPSIECPAGFDGPLSGGCEKWLDFGPPVIVNNCSNYFYSHNYAPGISDQDASAYYPVGSTDVLWTVTDEAGNISTCIQTITVWDDIEPAIDCGDTIVQYINEDVNSVYISIPPPQANDNCSLLYISNDFTGTWNANANYPPGITEITWTAEDIHNNTTSCVQVVNVVQTDNNGIICHTDTILTSPGLCGALSSFPQPEILLADGSEVFENSFNGEADLNNVFLQTGNNFIDWVVTDANNNAYFCTDSIFVIDDEDPIILCPDTLFAVSEPGLCGIYLEINTPPTIDNCGISTTIATNTQGAVVYQTFPIGITEITWLTLDFSSNFNSCNQVVAVTAAVPSSISCPTDQLATPDQDGNYAIPDFTSLVVTTLNCPDDEFVAQVPAPGTIIQSDTTISIYLQNSELVLDSCSFAITLVNPSVPEFICPDTLLEMSYNANCEVEIEDYRSLIDSNSILATGDYIIHQYPDSGTVVSSVNSIDLWITDESGNTSDTCSIALIVADLLPPSINQLEDLVLQLPMEACTVDYNVLSELYSMDNCDSDPEIILTVNMPLSWETGVHQISYFAIDDSGNTSDTLSLTLTVEDSNAPVVDSLEIENIFTCDPAFVCPQPEFFGCPGESIFVTPMFGPLQYGPNTIMWEATDGINTTYYSYTVTLINTEIVSILSAPSMCINAEPLQLTTSSLFQFDIVLEGNGIEDTLENQILNPSNYAPGTYFLSVAAGNLPCVEPVDFALTIEALPEIALSSNATEVCQSTIEIQAATNADNITWDIPESLSFTLQQADIAEILSGPDGTFDIVAQASTNLCAASDTLQITNWNMPLNIDAGPDQVLYLTSETFIEGSFTGSGIPEWVVLSGNALFDDATSSATDVSALETGVNFLLYEVTNGLCKESDSLLLIVNGLAIPNGFSPNADGTNDGFIIRGIENLGKAELRVYNRWGQIIFESEDYHNEWEGKNQQGEELPDDTYYYELKLDQESHQGFVVIKRG